MEHWTLLPTETDLLAGKHDGASTLAFALLLKFYGRYGRFPRGRAELRDEVVEFVAAQVRVPAADLGFFDWSGRTFERHRGEIRRFFGFRVFTVADGDKLTDWLAGDYAQRVRRAELVREHFLAECRTRQLEPPTSGQIDRLATKALGQGAESVAVRVAGRLDPGVIVRLLALVQRSDGDPDATDADADDAEVEADPSLLRWIKSSAGDVSLKTMLDEVAKLEAIRAFDLPGNVLRDVAVKVVAEWKHTALIESPSHVCRRSEPVQAAMLATLLLARQQEITDALVQLQISTVHRRTRTPFAGRLIPSPTAGHAVLRSTSSGVRPRRCSAAAAERPAIPPPTIRIRSMSAMPPPLSAARMPRSWSGSRLTAPNGASATQCCAATTFVAPTPPCVRRPGSAGGGGHASTAADPTALGSVAPLAAAWP